MNDPYAVLGLSPSASDEEVKRAYRALVKKYHPDNYVNNPLADLAEAKMKEINEAYDAIVKGRTQGGYQQQAQSNGNRYGTGGQAGQNPAFLQVRQLIVQNNLAEAERIAYKRGWMDDARQNFWTASSMEPNNIEYRQAVNQMNLQAQRGSYQGGDDLANLCTTLCCLNCLCNSCN